MFIVSLDLRNLSILYATSANILLCKANQKKQPILNRTETLYKILKSKLTVFGVIKNFRFLTFTIIVSLLFSCSEVAIKGNNNQFKTGVFEIPAGKGYSKTIITRIDSLQIEEYSKTTLVYNDSTTKKRTEKRVDILYKMEE